METVQTKKGDYVRFGQLYVGDEFSCNGKRYYKDSQDTAECYQTGHRELFDALDEVIQESESTSNGPTIKGAVR